MSGPDNMNNYVGPYNIGQLEDFDSNQRAIYLQTQQDFHPSAASPFSLHSNVDVISTNTVHDGNIRNRTTLYPPVSHYQPVRVNTFTNSSCPTCGSFKGPTGNRSISYILMPMPSSNVINEHTSLQYLVTKVEKTQSVMTAADFDKMLAGSRV
ncbi:4850_t:CDS:1 [Paraglomus brasilianum]|uniref:4850_t:CDS:1 n=1 Tax=Paraglomus brasilianum TaxID=144538 RepID=A0A9N9AGJ2_9GLOM|nr:4850_t:CDS:1 [Paraglomus brasilianum]